MLQGPRRALPVFLAILSSTLSAQLPEFEVASVKPTDVSGDILVGLELYPSGRLHIRGCELAGLIRLAFGLTYQQISGGADWTEQIRYDVQAVVPKDSGVTDFWYGPWKIGDERIREMLQSLLITRFQLKFHRETRTGDVYLLKQAGKPLPLTLTRVDPSSHKAPNEDSIRWHQFRQWELRAATMADLAEFATHNAVEGVPVLDRTALSGAFDYKQTLSDADPPHGEAEFRSAMSSAFLSLLKGLHLKLERAKAPIEKFVIDHAEKPSEN